MTEWQTLIGSLATRTAPLLSPAAIIRNKARGERTREKIIERLGGCEYSTHELLKLCGLKGDSNLRRHLNAMEAEGIVKHRTGLTGSHYWKLTGRDS